MSKPPFLVLLLTLSTTPALAQAPPLMPIQGSIHDGSGLPVDGDVAVHFALYTDEVGGDEVWSEDRTVTCDSGFFTLYLGEVTTLDLDTFADDGPLWLGLSVEGEAETDRLLIGTTGYAAFAQRAGEANHAQTADAADHAQTAGDAATVGGLDTAALRDWNGLQSVPAGFVDGIDNEGTPTTNASALTAGTLGTDRYSAYNDLLVEGHLDAADGGDLQTRAQADGRYVQEGQGASISVGMV